jgi:hypothetical protein
MLTVIQGGCDMQTISKLTTDDLKHLIRESIRESLSEKKLKDIFHEVIEDISLSKAIDKGMRTASIPKSAFMKKLKKRIK